MLGSRSTLKSNAFLFALTALLLFAGCGRGAPAGEAGDRRRFTDGLGRAVSITQNPQRIISLAPNVTEILFALGLESRVVGVTSYCDFPEAAKAKDKVGDTLQPNLEKIISLKPDLVVVSTSSQLENLTRRLDQLAIRSTLRTRAPCARLPLRSAAWAKSPERRSAPRASPARWKPVSARLRYVSAAWVVRASYTSCKSAL